MEQNLLLNERKDQMLGSTSPDEVVFVKKTHVVKQVDADVPVESRFFRVIRPLLVELIGTCLFLLVGMWGACSGGGVVQAALAFGLALMVFAAAFGHVSGVHFNPAVTLGIFIAGGTATIQPIMAGLYIVVQLLGGIAAGGILRLLLRNRAYEACKGGSTLLTTYNYINQTTNNVLTNYPQADSVQWWEGLLIEAIVTFMLVTVILMVALDTKSKTGLAPVIIGFTLAAGILGAGAFTGGSLNPARTLGPAVFSNKWDNHWIYWIGPLLGGALAGLLYRAVWAFPDRRWFVGAKRSALNTSTIKQ